MRPFLAGAAPVIRISFVFRVQRGIDVVAIVASDTKKGKG